MGVSKNSGTPKSSILIGFSIIKAINHPFWGVFPIFGNIHKETVTAVAPKGCPRCLPGCALSFQAIVDRAVQAFSTTGVVSVNS